MKLTIRNIESRPKVAKETWFWDDDLKGFGLRVWPSGRKVFVAQFRVGGGRNGRLRRVVIGPYGTFSPEEARAKAKLLLAEAALGRDPAEERDKVRNADTVNDLLDLWLREGVQINRRTGERRKERNIRGETGLVNAHLRRLLGKKSLAELTRGDIERMRASIATGETRERKKGRPRGIVNIRGGEGTAARTVRLLSSILSFAVDRDLIPANPARGIRLPSSRKMERYLTPEEFKQLGTALDSVPDNPVSKMAARILRLLILTGARRGEIENLKWTEVNFEYGMLRLVTSKTGQKVIPLARPAIDLLAEIRNGAPKNNPWVFPAFRGEGRFDGLNKEWRVIRVKAGIPDVRIHDLRHTFASVGAGGGVSLPLIAGSLGHRQTSTTQRYAHLADMPLRHAADEIGGQIADALTGKRTMSATAQDISSVKCPS